MQSYYKITVKSLVPEEYSECNPLLELQTNALKAITPATLDVMLKVLSASTVQGPTNALRQEAAVLKDLVLQCIVRTVHVIHECSPDQVSLPRVDRVFIGLVGFCMI